MLRTVLIACIASMMSTAGALAQPHNLGDSAPQADETATFTGRSCDNDGTPVCGWVLVNHLDGSIVFFDAIGTRVGSILVAEDGPDRHVKWRPPYRIDSVYDDHKTAIQNGELQAIANWILEPENKSGAGLAFFDWFLTLESRPEATDIVQSNVHTLLARSPYAIVAASDVMDEMSVSDGNPFHENTDYQSGLIGYWNARPMSARSSDDTSTNPTDVTLLIALDAATQRQVIMSSETTITIDMAMPQIKAIETSFLSASILRRSHHTDFKGRTDETESWWSWFGKNEEPIRSPTDIDHLNDDGWQKFENKAPKP